MVCPACFGMQWMLPLHRKDGFPQPVCGPVSQGSEKFAHREILCDNWGK